MREHPTQRLASPRTALTRHPAVRRAGEHAAAADALRAGLERSAAAWLAAAGAAASSGAAAPPNAAHGAATGPASAAASAAEPPLPLFRLSDAAVARLVARALADAATAAAPPGGTAGGDSGDEDDGAGKKRVGGSAPVAAHVIRSVDVSCDGLRGTFHATGPEEHLVELADGSGTRLPPGEFEKRAGRSASRNWRKSIYVSDGQRSCQIGVWLAEHYPDSRPSRPLAACIREIVAAAAPALVKARAAHAAATAAASEAGTPAPPPLASLPLPNGASLPLRIPVVCGGIRAMFLVMDTVVELVDDTAQRVAPAEFERLGGRESSRNWRRSVYVQFSNGRALPLGAWMCERLQGIAVKLAETAGGVKDEDDAAPAAAPKEGGEGGAVGAEGTEDEELADTGRRLALALAAVSGLVPHPRPPGGGSGALAGVFGDDDVFDGKGKGSRAARDGPLPPGLPGAPQRVRVSCDTVFGEFVAREGLISLATDAQAPATGERVTPAEFEKRAGRGNSRNWRKSIFVSDGPKGFQLGAWLQKWYPDPKAPRAFTEGPGPKGAAAAAAEGASPGAAGAAPGDGPLQAKPPPKPRAKKEKPPAAAAPAAPAAEAEAAAAEEPPPQQHAPQAVPAAMPKGVRSAPPAAAAAGPPPASVQVVCGDAKGTFTPADGLVRLAGGGPGVTPAEFEAMGGRAAQRNWRRSVFVSNPPARSAPLGAWLATHYPHLASAGDPAPAAAAPAAGAAGDAPAFKGATKGVRSASTKRKPSAAVASAMAFSEGALLLAGAAEEEAHAAAAKRARVPTPAAAAPAAAAGYASGRLAGRRVLARQPHTGVWAAAALVAFDPSCGEYTARYDADGDLEAMRLPDRSVMLLPPPEAPQTLPQPLRGTPCEAAPGAALRIGAEAARHAVEALAAALRGSPAAAATPAAAWHDVADRLALAAAPADVAGSMAWMAQLASATGVFSPAFTLTTLPSWLLICERAASGDAALLPALAAALQEAMPPAPVMPKQRPTGLGLPTGVYAAAAFAALAHASPAGRPMDAVEVAAVAMRLHVLPPALENSAVSGIAAALAADAASCAAFATLHPAPGPGGMPLYMPANNRA